MCDDDHLGQYRKRQIVTVNRRRIPHRLQRRADIGHRKAGFEKKRTEFT
jgi:hypothetical protein